MNGIFLTLEGIEGVGKSTALKTIESYLTERNIDFISTREPGGTAFSEKIRALLLDPKEEEALSPTTELLLMYAARAQHLYHKIRPALREGKFVISDRFNDASFAYQGGGRAISHDFILSLDQWVVKDTVPNATILLDAPVEIGMRRAKKRGAQDRIEKEKTAFFEEVRLNYLERAKENPNRIYVVDATQSLDNVKQHIIQIIDKILDKN